MIHNEVKWHKYTQSAMKHSRMKGYEAILTRKRKFEGLISA